MGSVELAILKEAQSGGFLKQIPETDEEISSEAEYYLSEAREAVKKPEFKKDKTVKAIISLGEKLDKQKETSANKQEEGKDIFGAPETATYRGLPVPSDPVGDPTPMPIDFTDLTPKEIMRLHAVYNGYAARARWMLSVAINKLASATHLRDAEYRKAYRGVFDAQSEKKFTQAVIDAVARTDEKVIKAEETVRVLQEDVTSLKALVEIYAGNVDRLSREWTMRQDEDKRSY